MIERCRGLLRAPLLVLATVVLGAAGAWAGSTSIVRRRAYRVRGGGRLGDVRLGRLVDHTGRDRESGSVYSIQTATLVTDTAALDAIWTPMHLERLARSYWRYIQHFSLGVLRVRYDDQGRYICLLSRRVVVLAFAEPEYEIGPTLGLVRWPIRHGLLVSHRRRDEGFLEIEVHRREAARPGTSQIYIELEVSAFYPSMSSGLAYSIYRQTQSRFHVLLAYAFIRSLAKGDLAESVVGRLVPRAEVEEHGPAPERVPTARRSDAGPG